MGQTQSEQLFDAGTFRTRHESRSSSGSEKIKARVTSSKRNSCPSHNHVNYAVNPLAKPRGRSATVSNAVPPVFPTSCSVYDKNFLRQQVYANKNEDEVLKKAVSRFVDPTEEALRTDSQDLKTEVTETPKILEPQKPEILEKPEKPQMDPQSSFEEFQEDDHESESSETSELCSSDSGRSSLNGEEDHNSSRRGSAPVVHFQDLAASANFTSMIEESEESEEDSQNGGSSPTQTYVRRFAKMEAKIRNERKMEVLKKKKRARSPFRAGLQRLRSLSLGGSAEAEKKQTSPYINHDFNDLVSVGEICRRLSLDNQIFASDLPIPAGAKESQILDEYMIRQIVDILPPRAEGYPWVNIYSSEKHGFSLATLYRKMADFEEDTSPVLLIIRDTAGHIFGGVSSSAIKPKDHYYGTGSSTLLWRFEGEFPKIKDLIDYRWTGSNQFFTNASKDCLSFGAGGGHFGLWLDADLNHGSTQPCETFDNEPLTGGETDFLIYSVEAFGFSM
ncbi:hypothetical protein L596_021702 [Steinernema carpocapsae]|uniref:Oxidation resistance protein 1 n=1 Tax=Steinernema carpocapsae TaxID=34508 RepID=A0A4U5MJM7_STECR|nr:hypothetical protein L596_021702 [Steinernema carpocapsae]